MGNTQTAQRGGANLPKEMLGQIGRYADEETRMNMRKTGKDAFMVPFNRGFYPHVLEMYANTKELNELTKFLFENDTPRNREIFVTLLNKMSLANPYDSVFNQFFYLIEKTIFVDASSYTPYLIDKEKYQTYYDVIFFVLKAIVEYQPIIFLSDLQQHINEIRGVRQKFWNKVYCTFFNEFEDSDYHGYQ